MHMAGEVDMDELVFGCSRLPAGKRRMALEEYLVAVVRPSFLILPYDEEAASWHGHERARLERTGHMPPFVDGQIAAIARCQGLTLITSNLKHFALFNDLETADWTR